MNDRSPESDVSALTGYGAGTATSVNGPCMRPSDGARAGSGGARGLDASVYRAAAAPRGPAGWWPARDAVRGLRRRHPRPEHRLDERREGARVPARGGPALVRRRCAGLPAATSWRRSSGPRAASTSRRGGWPRSSTSSGASTAAASRRMARERSAALRAQAPGRARHRPRDRRLDRALRRGPAALRRRRLHAAGVRAAGDDPRRRGLRRAAGCFMAALPRDAAPLQRLPRADRQPREGHLPPPAALRPLSARRLCPKRRRDRRDSRTACS